MSFGRVRQFQLPFNLGRFWFTRDKGQSVLPAEMSFITNLKIIKKSGDKTTEYDCGSGVVTLAGATLLAADWTNTTATLKLTNYHQTGTGTLAPSVNDTALQLAIAGIARVAGFQQNAANVYTSVATIIYNGSYSVTEWGIWTAITGGTLFDRRTFTAISVVNNDELQFIYSLTVQAGS